MGVTGWSNAEQSTGCPTCQGCANGHHSPGLILHPDDVIGAVDEKSVPGHCMPDTVLLTGVALIPSGIWFALVAKGLDNVQRTAFYA